MFKTVYQRFTQLDKYQQKDLLLIGLVQFIVLMCYPLTRSSVDAIFLVSEGAKKSPLVWTMSVLAISIVLLIYNRFLKRVGPKKIYILTSLISFLGFCLLLFLDQMSYSKVAYPLYILKEVYIVLLIHSAYAYLNSCLTLKDSKSLYGFLGAFITLGGVLGGVLTSFLSSLLSPSWILFIGAAISFLASYPFSLVKLSYHEKEESDLDQKISPFQAISNVKERVFFISLIVLLSQFAINIMNFKFNILIGELYDSREAMTSAFASIYTYINLLCLMVQILVIPYLFKKASEKTIHLLIPFIYILGAGLWLSFLGGASASIFILGSAIYILYKGIDYSIFDVAKEVFYFHFSDSQKFGAKYITDIFVYRLSKGLISFVLIYFQSEMILNTLLFSILLIWILVIFMMFKKKLPSY